MTLLVLEPPYQRPVAAGLFRPAVGAMLFADLTGGIPALARAVIALREAPWCPLIVQVADRLLGGATFSAFEAVPGLWAVLYPSDYASLNPVHRALAATRRRPAPSAQTVAQWLEHRLHRPGSASTFAACFGETDDTVRPPRTLTRRVQELGPLEVRDWRGLFRLAQILAARSGRTAFALETGAFDAAVDPRTLRRWLRLATPLSWSEVIARPGWEWILESALRQYGYVERSERRVSAES